jgi:hypothetical protein
VLGALLEIAGERPGRPIPPDEPALDDCLGRAQGLRRLLHPGPGQTGRPNPSISSASESQPSNKEPDMNALHNFLFKVYPYICLTVFFMGSLARFDRDQYTWKSDSSQLLRKGTLRWGSNLFHGGILFLFFGHLVGLFTPHSCMSIFISAGNRSRCWRWWPAASPVALCFVGPDHAAVPAHF